MIAIIHSIFDDDIIQTLKTEIKNKYPSILFELEEHKLDIVSNTSQEVIIVVIDESLLNEGYIALVKNAYPTLESFICLVSEKNQEAYLQKFGSVCKIVLKDCTAIQNEFQYVDGEPKKIEHTVEDEEPDLEELLDITFEEVEDEGAEESVKEAGEEDNTSAPLPEEIEGNLELEINLDINESEEKKEVQKNANEGNNKYEDKIIALRNEINVPVWKKQKIKSKSIGIWSPLHRIGVTTITLNLGIFIAEYNIPVAVLEGISHNLQLKSLLNIYNKAKKDWISYNTYLTDIHASAKQVVWDYKDVHFFPCEISDILSIWDETKINYYVNGLKFHDIVLIDLPTGEMESYTMECLKHIDELWIIVNNDILSIGEWKDYIENKVKPMVSTYMIFNETYEFSKPVKIAEQLNLELITSIPAMHKEIAKNHYENVPLIEKEEVYKKIEKSFIPILEHISGTKIKLERNKPTKERNILQRIGEMWK